MTFTEEFDPRSVVDHWTADILHRLYERPFRDVPNPELAPGVLNHLLLNVGKVAAGEDVSGQDWAVELLRGIWDHVCTGTPFGEPRGDWDYPEPRYMETLDEDERRGY